MPVFMVSEDGQKNISRADDPIALDHNWEDERISLGSVSDSDAGYGNFRSGTEQG